MKVNVCEVSNLFELPEFYPRDEWDETDMLECIAIRWEDINDPILMKLLNERVQCRRPRYIDEGLVGEDFSLEYDFSQEYPIEVGSFAVAYLDNIEFAGVVRSLCGECVEIGYFDTELGATDTIEVPIDAVEVILP